MQKILITGSIHEIGLELLRREKGFQISYDPELSYEEILKIITDFHCILTRSETAILRELIDNAPNLKVIARAAVGIGNIDVDYATEKGILVINTPGINTTSAAELAIGLLLSAMRNIVPAHSHMSELKWDRHAFTGTELWGKSIGIIGLGNVGHRVARYAKAFEMDVLAYDPYVSDEVFDILNTARGGVIQEKALLEALKSGKVAAAGIDTWEVEPPTENPFRDFPQVVMSPHVGASTKEAQQRIAESVATQIPRALRGEVVDYPVNMPRVKVLSSSPVSSYISLAEKLGLFSSQYVEFKAGLC